MKKVISSLLVVAMICSLGVNVFATTNYTNGTQVIYDGSNNESYEVTVPARLAPGQSGTVTLTGAWASNTMVKVTSDTSVELTNSINANDKKVLNVSFAGIAEAGSNTNRQTFTETVSVSEINNALFGVWSGHFNYNVETETVKNSLPVTATDSAGRDLNASAYTIEGAEKDDLLSRLEETDLIASADDVDALVEVESDEFDGLAETTFDVSDIAKTGDKVIILHFNEETQEWEFISEEIVDNNGKVTADFSSYSPVAFVVVQPDGNKVTVMPPKEEEPTDPDVFTCLDCGVDYTNEDDMCSACSPWLNYCCECCPGHGDPVEYGICEECYSTVPKDELCNNYYCEECCKDLCGDDETGCADCLAGEDVCVNGYCPVHCRENCYRKFWDKGVCPDCGSTDGEYAGYVCPDCGVCSWCCECDKSGDGDCWECGHFEEDLCEDGYCSLHCEITHGDDLPEI